MDELMERLGAAVAMLEAATAQMGEREVRLCAEAEERVGRIVASVEGQHEMELTMRLQAAEEKLAEAESRIVELTASGQASGRKTAAVGMVATLAKQGIAAGALEGLEHGRMEAGALDAALASLSIEQRFAVKAEMLRNGLLG